MGTTQMEYKLYQTMKKKKGTLEPGSGLSPILKIRLHILLILYVIMSTSRKTACSHPNIEAII